MPENPLGTEDRIESGVNPDFLRGESQQVYRELTRSILDDPKTTPVMLEPSSGKPLIVARNIGTWNIGETNALQTLFITHNIPLQETKIHYTVGTADEVAENSPRKWYRADALLKADGSFHVDAESLKQYLESGNHSLGRGPRGFDERYDNYTNEQPTPGAVLALEELKQVLDPYIPVSERPPLLW